MKDNEKAEEKQISFYKSGWFWSIVFFAAVCVIGCFVGELRPEKSYSLKDGRYFTSGNTAISAFDEAPSTENGITVLSDNAADVTEDSSQPSLASDETSAEKTAEHETADKTTERKSEPKNKAVYIAPTGKRYHYKKSCAGKNAVKTDIKSAKSKKYTPCKKCADG